MNENKDISLVILAAGLGSRYGGVKQLAPVGPAGEVIIDYSIHDAIAAGFTKIVFILRHDIFEDFQEVLGHRLEAFFRARGVKWEYVFQEMGEAPEGRVKPWGTGQALLSCKPVLREPFAVINADDYYGREGYVKACRFLRELPPDSKGVYGMVGFALKNTLSDNGSVTRGVCTTDGDGFLTDVVETFSIIKTPDGAADQDGDTLRPLDPSGMVSMNLWMLTPDILDLLESGFEAFKKTLKNPMKDEYLLPTVVNALIHDGSATVKVVPSGDRWYGVTYQEDLPKVRSAIGALHEKGIYSEPLFADLS